LALYHQDNTIRVITRNAEMVEMNATVPDELVLLPMPLPGAPNAEPISVIEKSRGRSSARKLRTMENVQKAISLRREGWTYEQIGDRLNVSTQMAFKYVAKGIAILAGKTGEDARTIKALILARMDSMLAKLWSAFETEDLPIKDLLGIVDRIGRMDERRARMEGLEERTPAVAVHIDMRQRAKDAFGPALEGATLEEKREMLRILEVASERREAEQRGQVQRLNADFHGGG
jgi:hypothetical protein